MLDLDHLAIAAETLEEGRAYVEDALGVVLQPGGAHARFGTHNLLLGLADGLYLEVIAVDPAAEAPRGARWFDLDRFEGRARPQVWVCRCADMAETLAAHPQAGRAVALERGDLRWQMAVPEGGVLPYDNRFPAFISWAPGIAHPGTRLAASGCALKACVVSHPDAKDLQGVLAPHLAERRVVFEQGPSALRFEIETPGGVRVLA